MTSWPESTQRWQMFVRTTSKTMQKGSVKELPRPADGLRYAANAADAILAAVEFHRSAECLRQDIVNWMISAYNKGVADGRALAEAERTGG